MMLIDWLVTLRNVKEVPMTEIIPVPYMKRVLGMSNPKTCAAEGGVRKQDPHDVETKFLWYSHANCVLNKA